MTRIICPDCKGSGRIPLPHSYETLTCGTCNGARYGTRFDCDGVLVNDDKWRDRCKRFAVLTFRLLDARAGGREECDTLIALEKVAQRVRADIDQART